MRMPHYLANRPDIFFAYHLRSKSMMEFVKNPQLLDKTRKASTATLG